MAGLEGPHIAAQSVLHRRPKCCAFRYPTRTCSLKTCHRHVFIRSHLLKVRVPPIHAQKNNRTTCGCFFVAGLEGLEPPNAGIRIRCLTNLAIAQYFEHLDMIPKIVSVVNTFFKKSVQKILNLFFFCNIII